jgi:uncharacterized membrane protein
MQSRLRLTDRCWYWGLLLIILIGLGLRAFRLDYQSMWYDEAISRLVGTWPLDDVLRFAFVDRVHPPLYFVAMHLWERLGDSVYLARFFSLWWGVLIIPLTYWLGRQVVDRRVAWLAAALVAISPFDVWFSQDIRMYTLATVWVLAATGFFIRGLRDNRTRDWLAYSLFVALAAYTHHVTLFIFLPHAIFLALQLRRWPTAFRRWVLAAALAAALYLPWLIPVALDDGFSRTATGWIQSPALVDFGFTAYAFSLGVTADWHVLWTWLPLIVWGAGWLLAWRLPPHPDRRWPQTLLVWTILIPLIVVWVFSLRKPFYVTRYFSPLQPLAAILACVGWGAIAGARRKWFSLAAVIVVAVYTFALYNMYFIPRYFRQDWRAAAQYLCQAQQPGDRVLMSRETINQRILLDYYCERGVEAQPVNVPGLEVDRPTFEGELRQLLSGQTRVWLVLSAPPTNMHGFTWADLDQAPDLMSADALKIELDRRLPKLAEYSFTGVLLILYDAN